MPEISKSKYRIQAGWDDVPHIDEQTKEEIRSSTPEFQRDARERGIPSLGSGAIYQVSLDDILVDPFPIPEHFTRAYGLDVGWNRTAAVWGAKDRESGIIYLYTEHYMGKVLPLVHAQSIKARGEWIKGFIDPAARGRSQRDGQQVIADYKAAGLKLRTANNAVEAGIHTVWTMLLSGRLKIFRTMTNWQDEYKFYRRDEHGKIIKKDDHLMDAMRYLIIEFDKIASVRMPDTETQMNYRPVGDRRTGY